MSDKVLIKKETMANIANAIREKNGGSDSYTPSEMAGAVASIETSSSDCISMEEVKYLLSYNKKSNVESEKWPASYHFKYSEELSIPMNAKNLPQEFDYIFDIKKIGFNNLYHTFSDFGNNLTCTTGTTEKRIVRFPYLTDISEQYVFTNSKITHLYLDELTSYKNGYQFNNNYYMRYINLKNLNSFSYYGSLFSNCGDLELGVVIYNEKAKFISQSVFSSAKIKELVLNTDELVVLQSETAFTNSWIETKTDTGFIFVKDELLDEYKNATNWSVYADKIKPISEWGGVPE